MSVAAQAAVWNADLDRTTKYVLLCMADHADHDGGSVRPSVGLIAWKSQYDERQVRRIIRDLETAGILVRENAGTGGRAKATEYRIAFDKLPVRPPFSRKNTDTATSGYPIEKADTAMSGYQNPDISNTRTFQYLNPDISEEYPDISRANPDIAMSPEPLRTVIEPPVEPSEKARAKRATQVPDVFEVSDELYDWAWFQLTMPKQRVDAETDKFLDHFRANGKTMKDWTAAWRNWMRNSVTFSRGKASNGRASPGDEVSNFDRVRIKHGLPPKGQQQHDTIIDTQGALIS